MRNFWLEADIDGRATTLAGGPRAKDGGMEVDIRQMDEGRSVLAVKINCYALTNSLLVTEVRDSNGNLLAHIETER